MTASEETSSKAEVVRRSDPPDPQVDPRGYAEFAYDRFASDKSRFRLSLRERAESHFVPEPVLERLYAVGHDLGKNLLGRESELDSKVEGHISRHSAAFHGNFRYADYKYNTRELIAYGLVALKDRGQHYHISDEMVEEVLPMVRAVGLDGWEAELMYSILSLGFHEYTYQLKRERSINSRIDSLIRWRELTANDLSGHLVMWNRALESGVSKDVVNLVAARRSVRRSLVSCRGKPWTSEKQEAAAMRIEVLIRNALGDEVLSSVEETAEEVQENGGAGDDPVNDRPPDDPSLVDESDEAELGRAAAQELADFMEEMTEKHGVPDGGNGGGESDAVTSAVELEVKADPVPETGDPDDPETSRSDEPELAVGDPDGLEAEVEADPELEVGNPVEPEPERSEFPDEDDEQPDLLEVLGRGFAEAVDPEELVPQTPESSFSIATAGTIAAYDQFTSDVIRVDRIRMRSALDFKSRVVAESVPIKYMLELESIAGEFSKMFVEALDSTEVGTPTWLAWIENERTIFSRNRRSIDVNHRYSGAVRLIAALSGLSRTDDRYERLQWEVYSLKGAQLNVLNAVLGYALELTEHEMIHKRKVINSMAVNRHRYQGIDDDKRRMVMLQGWNARLTEAVREGLGRALAQMRELQDEIFKCGWFFNRIQAKEDAVSSIRDVCASLSISDEVAVEVEPVFEDKEPTEQKEPVPEVIEEVVEEALPQAPPAEPVRLEAEPDRSTVEHVPQVDPRTWQSENEKRASKLIKDNWRRLGYAPPVEQPPPAEARRVAPREPVQHPQYVLSATQVCITKLGWNGWGVLVRRGKGENSARVALPRFLRTHRLLTDSELRREWEKLGVDTYNAIKQNYEDRLRLRKKSGRMWYWGHTFRTAGGVGDVSAVTVMVFNSRAMVPKDSDLMVIPLEVFLGRSSNGNGNGAGYQIDDTERQVLETFLDHPKDDPQREKVVKMFGL